MPAALLLAACGPRTPADLDYLRAVNAVAERRYEEARIRFAADLERHPGRRESLRGLALAWMSGPNQGLVPAMETLDAYLELEPGDDELRRELVRNLLQLGRWQEALDQAQALGDGLEARRLRTRALLELDPAAARAEVDAALALDPGDAAAHLLAADVEAAGDRTEAALDHLRAALAADPLRAEAQYRLGRMLLLTGERDAAARAFEASAELDLLGADDGAVTPVERLRVLDGLADRLPAGHPAVVRRRTVLRLEAGFVDEALPGVEALLEGGTLDAAAKIEIAGLLARRGRGPLARTLFEEVLDEVPDSRGARTGLVQTALEAGELDAARRWLDEGLEQEPRLARYRVLLARLERRQGDLEAARRLLDEAVELAPWETDWRLEIAGLALAGGDRRRAAEILDEAPEATPAIERFRAENGLGETER